MVDYSRDIDFDKYKTFFLEYVKDDNPYSMHNVRPCTTAYPDFKKNTTYMLEGSVLTFKHSTSIAEILIECSLYGVSIDFIDILVPNEDKESRWRSEYRISQIIDTHKEDVTKYFDKIEAPRHYIALNTNKRDKLKFLVIDRFSQDSSIEFLSGKYDKSGVIAGFKNHFEAKTYCSKANKENV